MGNFSCLFFLQLTFFKIKFFEKFFQEYHQSAKHFVSSLSGLAWKLTTVDPQERSTWRSGVRSAMRAASHLPGKGPTDVDQKHVNQKSDYDIMMMMMACIFLI